MKYLTCLCRLVQRLSAGLGLLFLLGSSQHGHDVRGVVDLWDCHLSSRYCQPTHFGRLVSSKIKSLYFLWTGLISEVELGAQSIIYELTNCAYMVISFFFFFGLFLSDIEIERRLMVYFVVSFLWVSAWQDVLEWETLWELESPSWPSCLQNSQYSAQVSLTANAASSVSELLAPIGPHIRSAVLHCSLNLNLTNFRAFCQDETCLLRISFQWDALVAGMDIFFVRHHTRYYCKNYIRKIWLLKPRQNMPVLCLLRYFSSRAIFMCLPLLQALVNLKIFALLWLRVCWLH